MATVIRLKRVGAKKEGSYRIVVVDSRTGSAGTSIERLGIYNPRTNPSLIKIDAARTIHWLDAGAEPSHTVRSLLRRTGLWEQWHAGLTAEALEQDVIELGPAPGARGTSQRPKPTDRPPEPEPEEPSAEAAEEAEEAPEEPEAEAAEEPEAEVEAEKPTAEAAKVEEESEEEPEPEQEEPTAEAAEEAGVEEEGEEPKASAEAEEGEEEASDDEDDEEPEEDEEKS